VVSLGQHNLPESFHSLLRLLAVTPCIRVVSGGGPFRSAGPNQPANQAGLGWFWNKTVHLERILVIFPPATVHIFSVGSI